MFKKLLPLIVLVLIVVAFFYKVIFLDYVLVDMSALADKLPWKVYLPASITEHKPPYTQSDSSTLYFPIFKFYSEQFKQGNFPTWLPTLAGGYPVLANSTNLMLNPFSILLWLLPPAVGYSWSIILKMLLAAGGMFLYLRLLKLKRGAALFGAVVYILNTLVMLKLEIPWMTQCLWSIPFLFYFLEKNFGRPKIYFAFGAALLLTLQFVGGHPQVGVSIALFAFLYCLAKWLRRFRQNGFATHKKTLLYFLVPFMLLPFLAAIQLLPMAELYAHGHRAPNELPMWMNPPRLSTAIFPQLYGQNTVTYEAIAKMERNFLRLAGVDYAAVAAPYLGLIPLLLILSTSFNQFRKNRYVKFFTLTGLALLVLQLSTPLWATWAQKIPLVNTMWNTYRINYIYIFSLSFLAAYGLHILLTNPAAIKHTLKKVWFGLALVVLLAFIFTLVIQVVGVQNYLKEWGDRIIAGHYTERSPQYYQTELGFWLFIFKNHFHPFQPTFLLPLVFLLITGVTFLFYFKHKIRARAVLAAFLLITLVDLFFIGWFYNPMLTKKQDVFPNIPPTEFLQKEPGLFRVSSTDGYKIIFPDSLLAYGVADIGIEHNIYPRRYNEYMSFIENNARASLENPFHTNLWLERYDSPLLDIFNVKYIITPPTQNIVEEQFKLVYDQEIKIYENLDALPRVFLVPQVEVIAERDAIFARLNDPQFNPLQTVILESKPLIEGSETLDDSNLTLIKYEPEEVQIKTHLTDNGFLILADTYYPGWEVYIDGQKDIVYQANYLSRGVTLRAGDHEVIFRFQAKTIQYGLIITTLTILGMILFLGGSLIFLKNKKEAIKTSIKLNH